MLLLTEDEEGAISLLKLCRNFTYPFDAVIFGTPVDVCYLFGILGYLTEDELCLLLYLYEATCKAACKTSLAVPQRSYLEAAAQEDLELLAKRFPNLYSYCGKNLTRFSLRVAGLKAEFRGIVEISSHENAIVALVTEIRSILEKKTFMQNSKPLVYPGGRGRKEDRTFLDTAIRETFEETKIHREDFCVLRTKPFFRETYISSDSVRYAQMFFLAKLVAAPGGTPGGAPGGTPGTFPEIELEGLFNEVVIVPLKDLDENDLLENTIKNVDLEILKHVSLKDARNYVTDILTSKQFLDTDVFKNYNTGKVIRDYKMAFVRYLAADLLEK